MSKIGFEPLLPAGALTPKNFAWLHAGKIRSLVEDWRGTSLDDLLAGRNETSLCLNLSGEKMAEESW
jgi:hypothetical protein